MSWSLLIVGLAVFLVFLFALSLVERTADSVISEKLFYRLKRRIIFGYWICGLLYCISMQILSIATTGPNPSKGEMLLNVLTVPLSAIFFAIPACKDYLSLRKWM